MLRIVAVERFSLLVVDKLCIVRLLETDSNWHKADSLPTGSSVILNLPTSRPSSTVEKLDEIVDRVLVELVQIQVPNVSCAVELVHDVFSMCIVVRCIALVGVE